MTEERAVLFVWSLIELATSDEGLIVGGLALLVIVIVVVIIREGVRLAHDYMRSL